MTAQGSALTRYRRALERKHIFGAEIAAKEMGTSGHDALGLLALYAAEQSPKYDKAAVRWLARLSLETDDLRLSDVQLAAAALDALPRRRISIARPHRAQPVTGSAKRVDCRIRGSR